MKPSPPSVPQHMHKQIADASLSRGTRHRGGGSGKKKGGGRVRRSSVEQVRSLLAPLQGVPRLPQRRFWLSVLPVAACRCG